MDIFKTLDTINTLVQEEEHETLVELTKEEVNEKLNQLATIKKTITTFEKKEKQILEDLKTHFAEEEKIKVESDKGHTFTKSTRKNTEISTFHLLEHFKKLNYDTKKQADFFKPKLKEIKDHFGKTIIDELSKIDGAVVELKTFTHTFRQSK